MVFWGRWFSLKNKQVNLRYHSTVVVKSNLFVSFLEEIDDPKNHFKINWPLDTYQFASSWKTSCCFHLFGKVDISAQGFEPRVFEQNFSTQDLNFEGD